MSNLRDIAERQRGKVVWVADGRSLSYEDRKWRLETTRGRDKGRIETVTPSTAARLIYSKPGGRITGGWDWPTLDTAGDLSLMMIKLRTAPDEVKTAIVDLLESEIVPELRGKETNSRLNVSQHAKFQRREFKCFPSPQSVISSRLATGRARRRLRVAGSRWVP